MKTKFKVNGLKLIVFLAVLILGINLFFPHPHIQREEAIANFVASMTDKYGLSQEQQEILTEKLLTGQTLDAEQSANILPEYTSFTYNELVQGITQKYHVFADGSVIAIELEAIEERIYSSQDIFPLHHRIKQRTGTHTIWANIDGFIAKNVNAHHQINRVYDQGIDVLLLSDNLSTSNPIVTYLRPIQEEKNTVRALIRYEMLLTHLSGLFNSDVDIAVVSTFEWVIGIRDGALYFEKIVLN